MLAIAGLLCLIFWVVEYLYSGHCSSVFFIAEIGKSKNQKTIIMSLSKIIEKVEKSREKDKQKKEHLEKCNSLLWNRIELNGWNVKDLPNFDSKENYAYVFFVDDEVEYIGKGSGKILTERLKQYVERQSEHKICFLYTDLLNSDTVSTLLELVSLMLHTKPNFDFELYIAEIKDKFNL